MALIQKHAGQIRTLALCYVKHDCAARLCFHAQHTVVAGWKHDQRIKTWYTRYCERTTETWSLEKIWAISKTWALDRTNSNIDAIENTHGR